MRYIESPNTYDGADASLFLAGGITNCPAWQADMVKLLSDTDLVLFNPRRADYPVNDPSAAYDSMKWGHDRLHQADAILFWFPQETLCPIVLYELGVGSMTNKALFVGVHPEYKRRQDVEIRTELARPGPTALSIVYSVQDLAEQVRAWDIVINRLKMR